jgi:tRNA threonylcarbamoyladenosine biosynthesis protein TsaB
MNQLLVIETSAATGSWALFENGRCVKTASFSDRASGSLAPSLLAISGELSGVEKIIIGVGPGSFSGIRVGIASAQGLSAVLNCPIIPIRSTHAIAWQYRDQPKLGIFADARRQQLFFTGYANGQLTTPAKLIPIAEVETYRQPCSLAISVEPITGISHVEFPTAENLGHAYLNFPVEPDLTLEPIYLHTAVK